MFPGGRGCSLWRRSPRSTMDFRTFLERDTPDVEDPLFILEYCRWICSGMSSRASWLVGIVHGVTYTSKTKRQTIVERTHSNLRSGSCEEPGELALLSVNRPNRTLSVTVRRRDPPNVCYFVLSLTFALSSSSAQRAMLKLGQTPKSGISHGFRATMRYSRLPLDL